MTAHIGDDAALYALGTLEESERDAIDAHVATCDTCARELAQACDDVTAMVAESSFDELRMTEGELRMTQGGPPSVQTRRAVRVPLMMRGAWFPALAAALLIALLPSAYLVRENVAMRDTMLAQSSAMERLASSPHRTVAFSGMQAEVAYGNDGSWYCVIIKGAKGPVDVAWIHDGTRTMLGTAVPHGDVAMLYLPQSHRMDQLALVSNEQTMGQARLVF